MADEPRDLTESAVVKRVLAAHPYPAERVLVGLLQTLVHAHMRWIVGGDKAAEAGNGILQDVIDELLTAQAQNEDLAEQANDDEPDNEAFMQGVFSGDLAAVQAVVLEILYGSRAVGEREIEQARYEAEVMGTPPPGAKPPDEDRPPMRLVRD